MRGQADVKEEVRKIIELWQAGDQFKLSGGKPERGLLFIGPPGTGKTMLAKAIATGFNAPFMAVPGSGFAQTFIGMDVVAVQWMGHKAKKLARKWGGHCIVFIDEIDAVGMRRAALGGAQSERAVRVRPCRCSARAARSRPPATSLFESREWRERHRPTHMVEAEHVPVRRGPFGSIARAVMPGMFGGQGSGALNQLLVVMDGVDNPPFLKRMVDAPRQHARWTPRTSFRSASGRLRLRLPRPKPRNDQVFFIGATNVPLERPRSRAHARGTHGTPGAVPHPEQGRPHRRARLLPRQGRRTRPTSTREKRRDELARMTGRLLAGDDRAGLLDRAHGGPPRRARRASTATTS